MKMLILCVALLTGCASTLPSSKVEIPVALLQPCAPLVLLQGTTGQDLLQNLTQNASIYWSCSDQHNKLIEAVKTK